MRALAAPKRRAILELVADRELQAGEIAERFSVTRPAISQHLTVLREAGLITERRSGSLRLYRARREGLAELRGFLAAMWPEALGRLAERAESTSPGRPQRGDPPHALAEDQP